MTSGIAALSFTRVGGDEIRKLWVVILTTHIMWGPSMHSSFGSLCVLFFRSVTRSLQTPRLIPSQWGAENWVRYGRNQDVTVGKGINLFSCVFIGEQNGQAVIAHKPHSTLPLSPLTDEDSKLVKQAKLERWKRTGMLTHSDAAMLASKILTHNVLGATVRNEIVRRFPLIIVDELQDTGYFLGKCIRCLLDEPNSRGILVGDPDQAIYEFNGARPDQFDSFESVNGAAVFTLPSSQRCPPTIAAAASHLKDSGGTIGVAAGKAGRVPHPIYRNCGRSPSYYRCGQEHLWILYP